MSCITCKGRGECGQPVCPIVRRLEELVSLPKIGSRMEGFTPPEVFVGRSGYPLVRAGPVLPSVQAEELPHLGMNMDEIISARMGMVRSETKIRVLEAGEPGKLLEACQQIAMSSAPVGAEVSFIKPPRRRLQFDGVLSPTGPSGELAKMEITTNPLIPRKVDQIVLDRGAPADVAIAELYSAGIDIDHLSRLLSIGLLGNKRRLVPTRWSITASDDMIGKSLKDEVLDFPEVKGYHLFSGEELGNHFEVLLSPRPFSFELIEIWRPHSLWAEEGFIGRDGEDARPKKGYSPLAGGYYAARLAVLEHLSRWGRQAGVLAIREISEDYRIPLGVWVVREVARKAMSSHPTRFDALSSAREVMAGRLHTPEVSWLKKAELLTGSTQKRLNEF
ncbi:MULTISPECIES: Nre family DNA repair protein [Methanothrix]|uniref:DNA repair protein n=2 Tax=Methanothrix soehngenii TaxID=2223 RepID=F4BWQ3_METSG|nr:MULTISPECIES: Nre family DNA repair protein [Methanothrix]AEB68539.1 protein of unknown function (DUF650/651) [Methanothrix soehngenii GP6]